LLSAPNYQDEWSKKVANYYHEKLNLPFEGKNTDMDNLSIKRVYTEVIKCLEKFTRALARQFVSGNLGKEARSCSVYFLLFLTLQDENLGKTDYSTKKFIIGT